MDLTSTKALIQDRLGLHFSGARVSDLERILTERIRALGLPDAEGYRRRLLHEPGELDLLGSLLTINESYFYREPQHLRLITEHLAPPLVAERGPADPIRILSVGCASGEEPYSVAMALEERFGAAARGSFRINGWDLDAEILDRARAGIYGRLAFRALSPELRERWFRPLPDGCRELLPELRERVDFHRVNLREPLSTALWGRQDLILFRNVSIYFDAAMRESVQRRLLALLRPAGALILGTTELLANDFGLTEMREHQGTWYLVPAADVRDGDHASRSRGASSLAITSGRMRSADSRSASTGAAVPRPPVGGPRGNASPPPGVAALSDSSGPRTKAEVQPSAPPPDPADASYDEALRLAREERFDAALALLTEASSVRTLTLRALLHMERGDPDAAGADARRVLDDDPWSADALGVLGRVARLAGDLAAAIGHLRRAVYACPDCWPPRLQLADLYRESDAPEQARREYGIALRLLEGPAAQRQAGMLPPPLPIGDLRLLCRRRLDQLALGD